MEQPKKTTDTQEQVALAWLKRCLDIDRFSEYIDKNILTLRVRNCHFLCFISFNISLLQYLPHAIAIVGATVLFRSIRLVCYSSFVFYCAFPHTVQ